MEVNVLLVGERRGRYTVARSSRFLGLLSALPIHVMGVADMSIRADLLSGPEHDLSAYDADYLRLAIHGEMPIATRDKKLAKAAPECGVELLLM
jgi:predicted nucleic acid-binding protein